MRSRAPPRGLLLARVRLGGVALRRGVGNRLVRERRRERSGGGGSEGGGGRRTALLGLGGSGVLGGLPRSGRIFLGERGFGGGSLDGALLLGGGGLGCDSPLFQFGCGCGCGGCDGCSGGLGCALLLGGGGLGGCTLLLLLLLLRSGSGGGIGGGVDGGIDGGGASSTCLLLVLPLLVLLLLLLLLFLGGYLRLGPLLLLPLRLALPLLAAVPRACVLRRLGGRAAAGKLWLMLWKITATAVIEESPIDTVGVRHVRALNACDGGHKFIESGGRAGMRAARRSPFARRPRGGADGRSHRRRRLAESAKEP